MDGSVGDVGPAGVAVVVGKNQSAGTILAKCRAAGDPACTGEGVGLGVVVDGEGGRSDVLGDIDVEACGGVIKRNDIQIVVRLGIAGGGTLPFEPAREVPDAGGGTGPDARFDGHSGHIQLNGAAGILQVCHNTVGEGTHLESCKTCPGDASGVGEQVVNPDGRGRAQNVDGVLTVDGEGSAGHFPAQINVEPGNGLIGTAGTERQRCDGQGGCGERTIQLEGRSAGEGHRAVHTTVAAEGGSRIDGHAPEPEAGTGPLQEQAATVHDGRARVGVRIGEGQSACADLVEGQGAGVVSQHTAKRRAQVQRPDGEGGGCAVCVAVANDAAVTAEGADCEIGHRAVNFIIGGGIVEAVIDGGAGCGCRAEPHEQGGVVVDGA